MNNCEKCQHSKNPQGGHCYMFKSEPEGKCMQHTGRRVVGTIGHIDHGKTTLTAAIASVLLTTMKKDSNDK